MSSICSANSRFNLAFSSSSAFSRAAIPEYFVFQAETRPFRHPCLRQRSAHFAPASCSCKMPMICSFVSRPFFIVRPLHGPDSNRRWRKNPVAGHQTTTNLRQVRLFQDRACHGHQIGPVVDLALATLFFMSTDRKEWPWTKDHRMYARAGTFGSSGDKPRQLEVARTITPKQFSLWQEVRARFRGPRSGQRPAGIRRARPLRS